MQTTIHSEALPGLALRTRLALARVQMQLDVEAAEDAMYHVVDEAQALGFRAYHVGIMQPGKLIGDDPLLMRAWSDGQHFAACHFDDPDDEELF